MFNDSPLSNRVYAYRANINLMKFNALEMKILRKLKFRALICPDEYQLYRAELENFWENKLEDLEKLYTEYKHDKAVLKRIKEDISTQQLNLKIKSGYEHEENNYTDPDMLQAMEAVSSGVANPCVIQDIDKFRFESYNSHVFKEVWNSNKVYRSSSAPRFDGNPEF